MKHCGDEVTTQDYRDSISAEDTNDGYSLAYQWQDKPHRHVFDLCQHIDELQSQLTAANAKLEAARKALQGIKDHPKQSFFTSISSYYAIGYAEVSRQSFRECAAIADRGLEESK
jgi:hypothetical protein